MRFTSFDGPIGHPTAGRSIHDKRMFDPVTAIVGGASIIGGVMSSRSQRKAGDRAADAQVQAAQLAEEGIQSRFEEVQKLLAPFVQGGVGAFGQMGALAGTQGNQAQQAAIEALKASPAFTSMQSAGQNAILQNAAATGGLRGGNVQASLAQFDPALLASVIQDQYGRLGGLAQMGQASAAGVGSAGMSAQSQIAQLQQQMGAARAGQALNTGQAQQNMIGSLFKGFGQIAGGVKF